MKDYSFSGMEHIVPLDMQVALKIAKKFSIKLVRDIETGHLIPYY
jgi:hypothetical protein